MGGDRKVRRGHEPAEHGLGVTLGGSVEVDARPGPVAGGEEREPLSVVPVEVSEQDRPIERFLAEQLARAADTRTGFEDQRRSPGIVAEHDTGGVPAVAVELRAR